MENREQLVDGTNWSMKNIHSEICFCPFFKVMRVDCRMSFRRRVCFLLFCYLVLAISPVGMAECPCEDGGGQPFESSRAGSGQATADHVSAKSTAWFLLMPSCWHIILWLILFYDMTPLLWLMSPCNCNCFAVKRRGHH